MGHREVRRVPMDFDAPLNQVWSGYRAPDWRPCPSDDCENGSTLASAWLSNIVHLILMLGEAADGDRRLHPWLEQLPLHPDRVPGVNVRELTGGLAGRPYRAPFGHDAIDRWTATSAIVKAAGLPEDWGTCPVCKGEGIHPHDSAAAEAWESTDPPTGDGWQLWTTTTEGSPISPVFASARELADWCATGATIFASQRLTAGEWLASFERGSTEIDSMLIMEVPSDA